MTHIIDSKITRRSALMAAAAGLVASTPVLGQDQFKEPVYRVTKAENPKPTKDEHPLDPAIRMANSSLKQFRREIKDYTAILVKRERINGTLNDHEYVYTKVRNHKVKNNRVAQPFSVYMYFLKPTSMKGREVLYVQGANKGKMIAHEAPGSIMSKFGSVWLKPEGPIAMKGQLYPITDVGIENLLVKLLERGFRDKKHDECDVSFRKGATINGRKCTLLKVVHPTPRAHFDFYKAEIFIDDELNMPIRYAAYTWPTKAGQKPPLLEEYTYLKLQLNPNLADKDFDHKNPEYNF